MCSTVSSPSQPGMRRSQKMAAYGRPLARAASTIQSPSLPFTAVSTSKRSAAGLIRGAGSSPKSTTAADRIALSSATFGLRTARNPSRTLSSSSITRTRVLMRSAVVIVDHLTRQRDPRDRSLAGALARELELAAQRADDMPRGPEPEPRPARLGGVPVREQLLPRARLEAGAVV